jgi:hypothetical protein
VADYVRAREWHQSQVWTEDADGRLVLTLEVCIDPALRSWILSFGPFARVRGPAALTKEIATQIDRARARYLTELSEMR